MRVGFAQINTTVGDIKPNAEKILAAYREASRQGAQLVITPELALTGYPPQDLVFKSGFVPQALEQLRVLQEEIGPVPLLVGYVDFNPKKTGKPFVNSCAVLERGRPIRKISKTLLPTYDVFDEARYFEPADDQQPIELLGRQVGITICEDIWTDKYLRHDLYHRDPVERLVGQGASVILNLSSSPFSVGKPALRRAMVTELALQHRIPFFYCNAVGGNDELIFDGNSFVIDKEGAATARLASFREQIAVVDCDAPAIVETAMPAEEEIFRALVLGVRDYFAKCGFRSAVLGLSGGIDSAVTAVIAVEALGKENVTGVSMPSAYSSSGSLDDADRVAKNLQIERLVIPIKEPFEVLKSQFKEVFAGLKEDATEENMQSRLRGLILMSLSNKFGHLLLTTGNKSELAVGYCTIYGDMCGGLAVISDVPKTMVYELAEWINREREIIPSASITKPPSAELKPDQTDQDTLPPYETLDDILQCLIEREMTVAEVVARGHDEATVRRVWRMLDRPEYKRRQAPPGVKITRRAFGRDRRYPITNAFQDSGPTPVQDPGE